jgi:hypothetical protein
MIKHIIVVTVVIIVNVIVVIITIISSSKQPGIRASRWPFPDPSAPLSLPKYSAGYWYMRIAIS